MDEFTCGAWYEIKDRGRVAAVTLNREVRDFTHLIGHEAMIDGEVYTVTGVESFAHAPPWRAGEPIGLLVRDK